MYTSINTPIEDTMEQYSVCFDYEDSFYVVVKWNNPDKKVDGRVVYKSRSFDEANNWLKSATGS